MAKDSVGLEDKEWSKRVSGGRGMGFAEGRNFAGGEKAVPCRYTDVTRSSKQFSRDSVLKAGRGRKNEKARNGRTR